MDASEEESSEEWSTERDSNAEEEEVDSITVKENLSVLSKENTEEKLLVSPDQWELQEENVEDQMSEEWAEEEEPATSNVEPLVSHPVGVEKIDWDLKRS